MVILASIVAISVFATFRVSQADEPPTYVYVPAVAQGIDITLSSTPTATPQPAATSTGTPTATATATSTPTATTTSTPTSAPTSAPNVIVIGATTVFTPQFGSARIVGEAINNGAGTVQLVQVTANLFDGSGGFVHTDSGFVSLTTLPPGEKSCWTILLFGAPAGWQTYQLEPPVPFNGGTPVSGLAVSSTSGSGTGTFYNVIGMVTNNSTQAVRFVEAIVTAYNGAGTVIGCGSGFVSSTDLAPGQTSSFNAGVMVPDASQVASFRVQVDGMP